MKGPESFRPKTESVEDNYKDVNDLLLDLTAAHGPVRVHAALERLFVENPSTE